MHDAFTLQVNSALHGLSSLHCQCSHTYPTIEQVVFMTCARIMLLHMATCWSKCLRWSNQGSSLTQHTSLQSQQGLQGFKNMQINSQPVKISYHAREATHKTTSQAPSEAKSRCLVHGKNAPNFPVLRGDLEHQQPVHMKSVLAI